MKSGCLMWGKGFLSCHSHVSVAVNTATSLPPKGSSLLSWECLFSCRVRCLPGFYVHVGLLMRSKNLSLKPNQRRFSWRNLCFPALCSSSFLELYLCTQTGWVPQGSSEVPSMPWGALPGQSSRLASAPGGCAELLTHPDFWGVLPESWSSHSGAVLTGETVMLLTQLKHG